MNCTAPPATKLHPAEIIEDEMRERGWSVADLVEEMGPYPSHTDHQIEYLAMEMYLTVREPFVLLGDLADSLGRVFNTGAAFWTNLQNAWRDEQISRPGVNSGF